MIPWIMLQILSKKVSPNLRLPFQLWLIVKEAYLQSYSPSYHPTPSPTYHPTPSPAVAYQPTVTSVHVTPDFTTQTVTILPDYHPPETQPVNPPAPPVHRVTFHPTTPAPPAVVTVTYSPVPHSHDSVKTLPSVNHPPYPSTPAPSWPSSPAPVHQSTVSADRESTRRSENIR